MEAIKFVGAMVAVVLALLCSTMTVAVVVGIKNAYDAQLRSRAERLMLMLVFLLGAAINGMYLVIYAIGDC